MYVNVSYRLTTANQHEYEDLIRFYKKYLPLEKVSVPKIEYELEQDSELDTEQVCDFILCFISLSPYRSVSLKMFIVII